MVNHDPDDATHLNGRQGADRARQDASADELEYLATYDGDPGEFRTPASLMNFARQVAVSDEPLRGCHRGHLS